MIYRSKFEARVAGKLPAGTQYEPRKFSFPISDPGYRCKGCGSKEIERTTSYTPDFELPNGAFVEAKGRLTSANRRRLVAFKAAYPDIRLYLVFQADNVLYRGSETRYSQWATKAGFDYCVGIHNIKPEWSKA